MARSYTRPELQSIGKSHADRLLIGRRLTLAAVVMIASMLVLAGRYWYLQIEQHDELSAESNNNRVRLRALRPNRGLILDRNGVVLAENRPSYRLEIVPERVDGELDGLLQQLGGMLEVSAAERLEFERRAARQQPFEQVVLRYDLTESEVARVAVNRHRLSGVEIKPYLKRSYPFASLTAHVVGYVGRLDRDDLQRVDPDNYRGTTQIGKTGLELYYEQRLHGQTGYEKVETNAEGRLVRVLERHSPEPGQDLHLTLDVALQRAAARALAERPGAVVAVRPSNGAVLAMLSYPTFDPNLFVDGIGSQRYRGLLEAPHNPLFNRALQGVYEPGSTIKPFLALAALERGVVRTGQVFSSTGEFGLPGNERVYHDWREGGHGSVSLRQALERSVNTVFYRIALQLGIDTIHDSLARFGFGRTTGIDLHGERSGVLPSRAWKRQRFGEPWYQGETVIAGIGQGFQSVSPLQLAAATATLASRGRRSRLHLWQGAEVKTQQIEGVDARYWEYVHEGMRDVVHGTRGTARAVASAAFTMAGKTGTAQVFSRDPDVEYDEADIAPRLRNHALFIAFAPVDAPEIAVAVVVEHGGAGSQAAAPVAREVIRVWLGRQGSNAP